MSALRNILTDLVEKRLWPVALALVAVLAIVPVVLGKPGEPTEVVSQPSVESKTNDDPTLALTRASATGFARAPRVNDEKLDPFGVRGVKAKKTKEAAKDLSSAADDVIASGGGGGGEVTTPGGGGTVPKVPKTPTTKDPKPTPTPDEPKVETEKDDIIAVLVQTGTDSEAKEIENVRTLSPLPDTENPFLVYMGRAENADKAMFLVSADVTVTLTGGGSCAPSLTDCRTLILGVGETAKFAPVVASEALKPMSITLTDIETKEVPVADGTEETEEASDAEKAARVIGAKALKSVLTDDEVVNQLVKAKVKIRH